MKMKKIFAFLLALVMMLSLCVSINQPAKAAEATSINDAAMLTFNKKKLNVKWSPVAGAEGYDVFVSNCNGKSYPKKATKTVKGTSTSIKKIGKKALKTNKCYKVRVSAFRKENGKKIYIDTALSLHATSSSNKKYTNAKSVTVSQPTVTLTQGQSSQINASVEKVDSKKKLLSHTANGLRFYSNNASIASVNAQGIITAVAAGSCKVYAVADNGVKAPVTVTVNAPAPAPQPPKQCKVTVKYIRLTGMSYNESDNTYQYSYVPVTDEEACSYIYSKIEYDESHDAKIVSEAWTSDTKIVTEGSDLTFYASRYDYCSWITLENEDMTDYNYGYYVNSYADASTFRPIVDESLILYDLCKPAAYEYYLDYIPGPGLKITLTNIRDDITIYLPVQEAFE